MKLKNNKMQSENILYVGKKYLSNPSGGREMLSALNYKAIKNIYHEHLFSYEIFSKQPKVKASDFNFNVFTSRIDGLNKSSLNDIKEIIKKNNINKIFIDGSNLGLLAREVKLSFSDIKIFTFFHNIEVKFFFDAFKRAKSLHSFGVFFANYFAEKKAVKYSDKIICLTKDDSNLLERIYRKTANFILPLALEDQFFESTNQKKYSNEKEKYILFVGGLFYANEFGIKWFIKNVSPFISFKTYIIGSGFEKLKEEFEQYRNVRVIGKVDELSPWYLNAQYIIAPIFEGSGMKTKVAEAFMFGKKILATRSALAGYDNLPEYSYYLCNTSKEYIDTIESLVDSNYSNFDENIRNIYEKKFSLSSSQTILSSILMGK